MTIDSLRGAIDFVAMRDVAWRGVERLGSTIKTGFINRLEDFISFATALFG